MESSDFLYNSFYPEVKDDIIIDLGLSLGNSFQPEDPYHTSKNLEYGAFMEWPQLKSCTKNSEVSPPLCTEETEGVDSSERWVYVKVNMDGVIIGRKICILDHASYSSLAHELEDMFGRHSMFGLRLFEMESEFSLVYKDKNENWKTVGDIPWKNFLENVKRLRITRKDEALFNC
ncbi:Iaa32p [Ranunculus cassubicifolius]